MGWNKTIWTGLLACVLVIEVPAGKLREFAEKATGTGSNAPPTVQPDKSPHASGGYHEFGTGTYPSEGDSFLGGFWAWVVSAPFYYRHDDPAMAGLTEDEAAEWAKTHRRIFPVHQLGEPTAPYVRGDYNYQYVDGDIDANDFRLELGYKAVAFHARSTIYTESTDNSRLNISQFYGLLRYGGWRPDFLKGTFEGAIGLGASAIRFSDDKGVIEDSAAAITLPLKYHPVPWFGVEFRPAWYSWAQGRSIGDYDLSASFGHRFVQLRGGCRALWLQGEGIYNDGPYVGLSASF